MPDNLFPHDSMPKSGKDIRYGITFANQNTINIVEHLTAHLHQPFANRLDLHPASSRNRNHGIALPFINEILD